MNTCQSIVLLIILGVLLLMIYLTKPWEAPKNNRQRWVRSILSGFGTTIVVIGGLVLMSLNRNSGNCLNDLLNLRKNLWFCIGLPVFVIVTVGNYYAYQQTIWLQSIRKKVDYKKK